MIETNPSKEIWIAVISAASGILGVLGVKEIIPAILKWWEEKRADSKTRRVMKKEEIKKLYDRIKRLEDDLDKHRNFEIKTKTAFNSMIPLMKEMMKDHPDYVKLLEQLQENIFGGEMIPADGHEK